MPFLLYKFCYNFNLLLPNVVNFEDLILFSFRGLSPLCLDVFVAAFGVVVCGVIVEFDLILGR